MDSLRFIVVCLATVLMVLPIQGLEGKGFKILFRKEVMSK